MSSSKTLTIIADALLAKQGSSNLGAGAGSHLPVGYYSGYVFRALMKFNLDWAGVAKIVSATLYVRNSTQNHLAFGSDPRLNIGRLNSAWSEGTYSCESGYSASNSVVYPGPGTGTLLNSTGGALDPVENQWTGLPLTETMESWAPATVLKRDGSPGGAAANHGICLYSQNEGSAGNTTEFWSRSSTSDPYIVLVYESNQPPVTPTASAPSGKLASTVTAPVISFSTTDPDSGDTASVYDLQVGTDSTFASGLVWNVAAQTLNLDTARFKVDRPYAGTGLAGGTTYYWRGRIADAAGAYSPWSATKSFSLNRPPTISALPNGGANGMLAVWNMADLVNTLTPKAEVPFTLTDADGDAITEYQVEVGGTAETVTGSRASGSAVLHKSTKVLVNGAITTLRIRAKDAMEYGPWSTIQNFKVWYAQSVVEWAVPGGSSGWSVTTPGVNVQRFQLLYRTATGPNGAGAGAWRTSLPTSGAYFNIMVRTCSLTGTAPARPQVGSIRIDYTSTATPPYQWVLTGTGTGLWTLDSSVRRYGINSLKCDLDAATTASQTIYAYQDIAVSPDQSYVASVWVKTGSMNAPSSFVQIRAYVGGSTATLLKSTGSQYRLDTMPDGWSRLVMPLSVDDLQGNTNIRFGLFVTRTGLPSGTIWWDAAMLSEGDVAPVWTPALIGVPAVLDANGVLIDASQGGIFQLTGSAGGARDTVDLGVNGLLFGGDTNLSAPVAKALTTDGHFALPSGRLRLSSWVSPTALAANVEDWNPPGLATANILRIATDATVRSIGGIVAGVNGDILILVNINSTVNITLVHASAGSVSTNRLICPGNVNLTMLPRSATVWVYDSGIGWRNIVAT